MQMGRNLRLWWRSSSECDAIDLHGNGVWAGLMYIFSFCYMGRIGCSGFDH